MDKIIELITVKNAVKIGAAIGFGYSAYRTTRAFGDVINIAVTKAATKALSAFNEAKRDHKLASKESNKPFQQNARCGF